VATAATLDGSTLAGGRRALAGPRRRLVRAHSRRWSDLRKAFAASTQLLAASCLLSSLMLQSASFMKVSPA
jgi:hypothetical protein